MSKAKTKTYKIIGMDCASCAMLIEGELQDLGIKASCSYAKETLDVEINDSKHDEDKIRDVVKSIGYDLQ